MAEVEVLKSFVLVMVRMTGLILTAPILSTRTFPVMAKAGFAAMAAAVITPTLDPAAPPLPDGALAFGVAGGKELIVGAAMGFAITVGFAAIQVAGELMDMLTGFSVVNVFNPALETQVPVFGFIYYIVAILYLLVLDGHHLMIRGLAASFEAIPLGGAYPDPTDVPDQMALWGRAMFVDGLLIAAPVAGALLLAYVTMGLLGRLVPQIHLFVVGFPITIAIGLSMAAVSLGAYLGVLDRMFDDMFRSMATVMEVMR